MSQLLLLELVLFVVTIMAVVRVWRASTLDGVLTLLLPFYFIVSTVKYWKDPDHDIRWHVLILVLGGGVAFWLQQRLLHDYLAEQAAYEAALRDTSAQADGDDEDGDDAADPSSATTPGVTIEIGPASRLAERQRRVAVVAKAEQRRSDPEARPQAPARAAPHRPQTAALAETAPVAPPTLRQALAMATFQRGRFARESSGFALDLPTHFHALAAVDARRIEASLGQAADVREVAWVLHESVEPGAPGSWHVSVRWLDDGWAAPAVEADPAKLLREAQNGQAKSRRLLGSGGALVGWAVAPRIRDSKVDWVEERVPDQAAASVLDCHALRAGRTGVVEFSIVGAAAGSQALCNAVVRLLADNVRFERDLDYPPNPPDGARAPYSLHDLVAHQR
jgi:hypothetical protein